MNEKVLCPWCGDEMKYQEQENYHDMNTNEVTGHEYYYICACGAESRHVVQPEAALAAAQKRWVEPNRVLTLDEAREADVVWFEEKNLSTIFVQHITPESDDRPTLQGVDVLFESFGDEVLGGALRDEYRKTWRCWLRKPTAEERAAVPWGGDAL